MTHRGPFQPLLFCDRDQRTLRVLGTVAVDNSRSHTASMHRKMYMGSWRLRSFMMVTSKTKFPKRAAQYIMQTGMEIQV